MRILTSGPLPCWCPARYCCPPHRPPCGTIHRPVTSALRDVRQRIGRDVAGAHGQVCGLSGSGTPRPIPRPALITLSPGLNGLRQHRGRQRDPAQLPEPGRLHVRRHRRIGRPAGIPSTGRPPLSGMSVVLFQGFYKPFWSDPAPGHRTRTVDGHQCAVGRLPARARRST